jgi:hypothetical protein
MVTNLGQKRLIFQSHHPFPSPAHFPLALRHKGAYAIHVEVKGEADGKRSAGPAAGNARPQVGEEESAWRKLTAAVGTGAGNGKGVNDA